MAETRQVAVQRAASLVPLVGLLAESDVALETVLSGTGVSADQLQADRYIPYVAFNEILENAARLTGRGDIGIALGQLQTLATLGPVGTVMWHAATLGEALSAFTAFQIHNSTGGTVYLLRAEQDIVLGYGVYDPNVLVSPVFHDLVCAVGCSIIAELTGGAVGPEEILLSRAAPVDVTPYRRLGRCPVRFGQIQTGLLLHASALAFPLPEADEVRHVRALNGLISRMKWAPHEVSGQVRHLLRPQLLMGRGNMDDVAARLGLHTRVLRRRLQAEGTTFEAIKDEVRFAAARELLKLDTLSIEDIAATLDYGSASSFLHAFRRWSGQAPGKWRRQQMKVDQEPE